MKGYLNMHSARMVTLIEVTVVEGEGTPDNPASEIVYYFTAEGDLVAIRDIVDGPLTAET